LKRLGSGRPKESRREEEVEVSSNWRKEEGEGEDERTHCGSRARSCPVFVEPVLLQEL